MPLIIGEDKIKSVYVGERKIQKAYGGQQLVYQAEKRVGDIVKLNVDGVPTEFIIVHHGLPSDMYDESCDGMWLLLKEPYTDRQWNSSNINDYEKSTINTYLNNTFLKLLDANIQQKIKSVKIPYRPGSGTSKTVYSGEKGLSVKVFLLAAHEVKILPSSNIPDDGYTLEYFNVGSSQTSSELNKQRIAYANGEAVIWWLRTPSLYNAKEVRIVPENGTYSSASNCINNSGYWVRPALILPSDTKFTKDNTIIA